MDRVSQRIDKDADIEGQDEALEDAQTVLPDGRIRTDHDVYPPSDYVMPKNHIFKASYMGENIALETLKFYYTSNNFSICNVDGGLKLLFNHELLTPALERSVINFAPIDHVRNLQIRVKCEHFRVLAVSPVTVPEHRIEQFVKEEAFLRHTVESLTDFRHRISNSVPHELNVEIILMSDLTAADNTGGVGFQEHMYYRITNLLQTIRNLVYELKYDRKHTTVKVTHQDDGLMAFPKNYTGLFHLTRDEWDYVCDHL
jgi:hypothetical protein